MDQLHSRKNPKSTTRVGIHKYSHFYRRSFEDYFEGRVCKRNVTNCVCVLEKHF